MKIFRFLMIASLCALVVAGAFSTRASASLFPSYTSSIQIQNLSSTDANVTLTFYNQDGSVREAVTVTPAIPGLGSKSYFPMPLSDPSAFNGSMVISSDQPLAVISNLVNNNFTALDAFTGGASGATTVYLPVLQKGNGGTTSWFSVQNAGTADASVVVKYSDCTNPLAAVVVKPGASATFDQGTETCHTGKVFSASVTSGQPLLAVVVQENATSFLNMMTYPSFIDAGSTTLVVPLVNNQNTTQGWITGVQILNTGTQSTDVTLTYVDSSNPSITCNETQTVPNAQSKTFSFSAFLSGGGTGITTTCTKDMKLVGSASVTANSNNQTLLAVVNQLNILSGKAAGSAYDAFDPGKATSKVVFPLVMDRNGTAYQYYTSINVMNVGSAATFVKCTFTGSSNTVTSGTSGLGQGQALNDLQYGKFAPNYVGSATCQAYTSNTYATVDSAAKLVGVANEASFSVRTSDQVLSYNGINQ